MSTELLHRSNKQQNQGVVDGVFTADEQSELDREMLSAQQTRQSHLATETSLKKGGQILGWLGGGILAAGVLSMLIGILTPMAEPSTAIFVRGFLGGLGLYLSSVGVVSWITGYKFRRLDYGSSRLAWLTAILALPLVPIGTLASAWLFYQLSNDNVKFVLSREYQRIIAFTK